MSDSQNVKKFSISMEPELMDWVDKRVKDLNKKDRRLKSSRSAVICDAVERLRDLEAAGSDEISRLLLNEGNGDPSEHANVIRPSASGVGGSSTRQTVIYRKTGKVK